MLTTVQPRGLGVVEGLLGAGRVVELALGVVVQQEQTQRRAVVRPAKRSMGTSPLELPPARIGRRPIRLQMPHRLRRPVVEEVHLALVERLQPDGCAGETDLAEAGAEHALPGDERRPAGGAAGLGA